MMQYGNTFGALWVLYFIAMAVLYVLVVMALVKYLREPSRRQMHAMRQGMHYPLPQTGHYPPAQGTPTPWTPTYQTGHAPASPTSGPAATGPVPPSADTYPTSDQQ